MTNKGNKKQSEIEIFPLGQVGYRFHVGNKVVYIDPYLTDSVQEKENEAFARMISAPVKPEQIDDADYVLITHAHRDHCDEDTLIPLYKASENCKFVGPRPVCTKLLNLGFKAERIICAQKSSISLFPDIKLFVVPAAHPEIELCDNGNGWQCVGYVIEYNKSKLYHAGDTSLRSEIIDSIRKLGNIDLAMIPVNEQNYMREKQGIIGNMSVREAFFLGEQIKARTFVPTHWDMFEQNQVYKEEIKLLYELIKPNFVLEFKEVCL